MKASESATFGFVLASLLACQVLPAQEVISLNFGAPGDTPPPPDALVGAVPRSVWIQAAGKSGGLTSLRTSSSGTDRSGLPSSTKVTWEGAAVYQYPSTDTSPTTRVFRSYLDDGATQGTGPVGDYGLQVTLTDLPWATHTLYLYVASDDGKEPGASVPFQIFEVNGKNHKASKLTEDKTYKTIEGTERWAAEGIPSLPLLEGRNYLRIETEGPSVTIRGYARKGSVRGSLTALQIVERAAVPIPPPPGYRWGW